jgi:toluene monooxygenase system protein D
METSGSRSPNPADDREAVGPVLTPGPLADAVIAAIRGANAHVTVIDRGAYLRVLVPRCCRLEIARVEGILKAPFRLPADLEAIMPSFRGRLEIAGDQVRWELPERPRP